MSLPHQMNGVRTVLCAGRSHTNGAFLSLLVLLVLTVTHRLADAQDRKKTFLASGYWQMSETYTKDSREENTLWSFELLDDGRPSIVAIGRRLETNGRRVQDRAISIFLVEKNDDGSLTGSYLEAYGDGDQAELPAEMEASSSGREVNLVIRDSGGAVLSTFKGDWIGNWAAAPLQAGSWTVREIVSPDKGAYDIQWSFQMQEKGGKISGTGQKAIVNGRKAQPGERKTNCEISLDRNDYSVAGKGVETNHQGKKTRVTLEGWVSPAGRAFFLMSTEKGKLAALLVGRHEE